MSKRHTPDMTLVTGAVRYRDLAYVAMTDDNIEARIGHTHLYDWDLQEDGDDKWGYIGATHWATVSMAISRHPLQQMIAISPHGEAKLFGSQDEREERIHAPGSAPAERGHLRAVRTIGERTFAVGMHRQVYRRDAADQWTCLDQAIRPAVGETKGFEAIDGFHEADLYAVGWDGEIWHFDGQLWTRRPSPTPHVLTGVLCAGDGQVYAWGRRGLVVAGRGEDWRVVPLDPLVGDIGDMAWHAGALYVATRTGLSTLDGGTLAPVAFGADAPGTVGTLSSADGMLWAIGPKDIMALEHGAWRRIE
ncbi:hypothetical protein LDO32_10615 [Luteimonas sp. Y-2-2-4F]|nr:hypothetical protein [Luteimonas sp. Y-2-2-4F]MCD9032174.1 hypothetical protein [Luteimonas sp. Y-2-2-4F]